MRFNASNKLIFIDSFQCLILSLDSLVANLSKDNFKYFGQKFDSNVLDLPKRKELYPYEYMKDFGSFKEQLPGKGKLHNSLMSKIKGNKE